MSKLSYTPLYSVQKYPKVASVTAFRLLAIPSLQTAAPRPLRTALREVQRIYYLGTPFRVMFICGHGRVRQKSWVRWTGSEAARLWSCCAVSVARTPAGVRARGESAEA